MAKSIWRVYVQPVVKKLAETFDIDVSDMVTWSEGQRSHSITDKTNLIKVRVGGTNKRPYHNYYLVGTEREMQNLLQNHCKCDLKKRDCLLRIPK